MTKGTDTLRTNKIIFSLQVRLSKPFRTIGLKRFQKHLEQVEKDASQTKFHHPYIKVAGPFTLLMPRTSWSPCHIVGVVAHLPRV